MPQFIFPASVQIDPRRRRQVIQCLRREGFPSPSDLSQEANGRWRCSTTLGGRVVDLTIDKRGTVIAVPT